MFAQRIILPRLNCDKFISLSKFIVDEYFSKWGIKNVVVIPSGVNLNEFNPYIDGSEIRKKYSISKDTILLVTAKQLYGISAKGIEDAIRALPLVTNKHKNLKYIIVGEGDGKKGLENLTKKLRLEKYIIFVGGRLHEEIPKYLAAADIIIQTFAIEVTAGMSLLEAMGMGKPLLVTESGEIKNILNNSTAMLVKMGNPNSIADGIIKLIENPDLRERIGKNVYELTKDKYSIDNMARTILTISDKLLNPSH
jgi:glycosyltransferase involved in cell wall biosynthesis